MADRIYTDTPFDKLNVTYEGLPRVDDLIVNEQTNDDVIAAFPKKKNDAGTEQVWIDENGFIDGVDAGSQPAAPAAPAADTSK